MAVCDNFRQNKAFFICRDRVHIFYRSFNFIINVSTFVLMCIGAFHGRFSSCSHRPTIASNYINRNKSQHHIVLLPWLRSWCCSILFNIFSCYFRPRDFRFKRFFIRRSTHITSHFAVFCVAFTHFHALRHMNPYRRLCGRFTAKIIAENFLVSVSSDLYVLAISHNVSP